MIFASKYKTILPTEDELADMIARESSRLLIASPTPTQKKKGGKK